MRLTMKLMFAQANAKLNATNRTHSERMVIIWRFSEMSGRRVLRMSTEIDELEVSTMADSVDIDAERSRSRMTLRTMFETTEPEKTFISSVGMTAS